MTRILLSPGQPIAEARRQLRRSRLAGPVLTGEAVTASSQAWAATATGSATPHTKGAYTQLVAATTVDTYGLIICLSAGTSTSATDSSALVDIAVGAAGSEVVVVPNLALGWRTSALLGQFYRVPVFIPAGSRVAARAQGAQISKTVPLVVTSVTRSLSPSRASTTVTDIGTNTATSAGVVLTVPASNNTKGAWTQITAATVEPYTALCVGIQGGNDTTLGTSDQLVDIGVGASGSEVTVLSNLYVATNTSESVAQLDSGPWLIDVPAGSRIAVRYQTTSLGTSLDAIAYGIR